MRALVLLWGCLALRASAALTCPEEVSAFEGDTVTLRCTYEGELRTRPKYWCREVGVFISRCSNKIFSGEDGQEVRQGRASIRDRPGELALVVTLRGLTRQDSGKYWCGAQKLGPDDASLVALTVLPASPDQRSTVASPQQGRSGAAAPLLTETATSHHAATAPDTTATSPHTGRSRPAALPDSSIAGDPGPVSSSHSSVPSISIPTARLLAPILVLLSLLLAAGLIALGAHLLQGRRPAPGTSAAGFTPALLGLFQLFGLRMHSGARSCTSRPRHWKPAGSPRTLWSALPDTPTPSPAPPWAPPWKSATGARSEGRRKPFRRPPKQLKPQCSAGRQRSRTWPSSSRCSWGPRQLASLQSF